MSQPFDLDAAVGERAGEPFPFTWGGKRFELPPILTMDIAVQLQLIDLVERLDVAKAEPKLLIDVFNLILGADRLAEMRAARPVGAAALMVLIEQWMGRQGGALGKFTASPASSVSTAQPSKPTSRSGRGRKTS